MKKLLWALGLVSINTAYALPSNLIEDVYLKSYSCGADSCYLDIELANIQAVSISTFCGDRKYCTQYHKAYEKIESQADEYHNEENYPKYDIDRKAKVTLKLVNNNFSGEKMYEVTAISYLKD